MSMDLIANPFKRAILAGHQQIGMWNTIRDPYIGEMLAGTGYDWILIDCEHTPRDLDNVLQMMQAMGRHDVAPVVRVTHMDAAEIKRVLDIGAQNILVPYVRDVAEAEAAAQAVAYPPRGHSWHGRGDPRQYVRGKWTAISPAPVTRFASWYRLKPKGRLMIWRRSPPWTASMRFSSVRRIWRPRLAIPGSSIILW